MFIINVINFNFSILQKYRNFAKRFAKLAFIFEMCNKKIFFREFGNGKPLVFLHGIMGCSDYWIPFAQSFAKDFKVILVDLPNHGKSIHTDTIIFSETAKTLTDFFRKNGIDHPFVVGHSYGAKIAFQMLADDPTCLSALVAVDMLPNSSFTDNGISGIIDFASKPLPRISNHTQAGDYFSKCGFSQRYTSLLQKSISFKGDVPSWKFNADVISKDKRLLAHNIAFERNVEIPVMILKGSDSGHVRMPDYEALKPFFSDMTICEVPNAGHWVQVDNPTDFINMTKQFLNTCNTKR